MRYLAAVAALVAAFLSAGPAAAATITVTTTNDELGTDPGACSLREAIQAANADTAVSGCAAGSGDDTIELKAGSYAIDQAGMDEDGGERGDLDVSGPDGLSIDGSGRVVLDGEGRDRVLDHLGPGPLTLTNLRVTDGSTASPSAELPDGGGILNEAGTLTLSGVTLDHNHARDHGGALANYGSMALVNVTVSDNWVNGSGGGVYAAADSTSLLRNVTIAHNIADHDADSGGDGGGVAVSGAFAVFDSIIGDNVDASPAFGEHASDCLSGPGFFPRYTLIADIGTGECQIGFDPGTNLTEVAPRLGPLRLNGGPTPTRGLLLGSPAINAGGELPPDNCASADQRGMSRPQGPACDLGAFEVTPYDIGDRVKCGGKSPTIVGTPGRDVIRGTARRDVIVSRGGPDLVFGYGGDDLICGGRGSDKLVGGKGNDKLAGNGGRDFLRGGSGRDSIGGGAGRDSLFGNAGSDWLDGGPGRDVLRGGRGRDRLTGGPGKDFIRQ